MWNEVHEMGCMYTYSWFTLLHSRNEHNNVKQLYSNTNFLKKKRTVSNGPLATRKAGEVSIWQRGWYCYECFRTTLIHSLRPWHFWIKTGSNKTEKGGCLLGRSATISATANTPDKKRWRERIFWACLYKTPFYFSLLYINMVSPGGPVVKNPLANAWDTGLIPGLGSFHMPWATKTMCHNYWACALNA